MNKELNTSDFITEAEREQICNHHCDDLICSRHCAVWRKAEERRAENDRQNKVYGSC